MLSKAFSRSINTAPVFLCLLKLIMVSSMILQSGWSVECRSRNPYWQCGMMLCSVRCPLILVRITFSIVLLIVFRSVTGL
uniref:Putative product n=1 Tax=Xenopsylla cheopis TaxID=163159 RepID=A0A6M2E3F4_XENCH